MLQASLQATNAELEAKLTDSASKFMEALAALQMLEAQVPFYKWRALGAHRN